MEELQVEEENLPKIKIKKKGEEYEPWNQSYEKAVYVASFAVLMIWIGLIYDSIVGNGKQAMIILSLAPMVVSAMLFKTGMSREFGKSFELKWVGRARSAFEGTSLSVGKSTMTKGGDVDVLVHCAENLVVNVEIKSWRSYGKDIKYLTREKNGLSQIHAQRGSIEAIASVLWLPQASDSFMQSLFGGKQKIDDDTYLCRGNARKLRKLIEKVTK